MKYDYLCRGNARVTRVWSHGHVYNIIWVKLSNSYVSRTEILTSEPFFQNAFILRSQGWSNLLASSKLQLFLRFTAWKVSKCGVFLGSYSVRMQKNADHKNAVFGHFSHSACNTRLIVDASINPPLVYHKFLQGGLSLKLTLYKCI